MNKTMKSGGQIQFDPKPKVVSLYGDLQVKEVYQEFDTIEIPDVRDFKILPSDIDPENDKAGVVVFDHKKKTIHNTESMYVGMWMDQIRGSEVPVDKYSVTPTLEKEKEADLSTLGEILLDDPEASLNDVVSAVKLLQNELEAQNDVVEQLKADLGNATGKSTSRFELLGKDDREKRAKAFLEANKEISHVHVTSDGEIYLDEGMAMTHTRIIRGVSPVKVRR